MSYSLQLITDTCFDPTDPDLLDVHHQIFRYPDEGVYIYSFSKGKMLYCEGWEQVIGYQNTEISMRKIVESTAPEFVPYVFEMNDKALLFLQKRSTRLTEYYFKIEIRMISKNLLPVPVTATVSVFSVTSSGHLDCIMGRFQKAPYLRFGRVMRFSAYGPEKDMFEMSLNEELFRLRISEKETEVIRMLANGLTYKEIADRLQISTSAVEKRVRPLFQRFGVHNNTHLVAYAYENGVLP